MLGYEFLLSVSESIFLQRHQRFVFSPCRLLDRGRLASTAVLPLRNWATSRRKTESVSDVRELKYFRQAVVSTKQQLFLK
jgi:hypothetical protein